MVSGNHARLYLTPFPPRVSTGRDRVRNIRGLYAPTSLCLSPQGTNSIAGDNVAGSRRPNKSLDPVRVEFNSTDNVGHTPSRTRPGRRLTLPEMCAYGDALSGGLYICLIPGRLSASGRRHHTRPANGNSGTACLWS